MNKIIEQRIVRNDSDVARVILIELKNGYGVYYHIENEDRYSECYTTPDYYEALECYKNEIFRNSIKNAILRVAKRRVSRGATREHIREHQEKLLSTCKDSDIRTFIHYIDRMVFEHST